MVTVAGLRERFAGIPDHRNVLWVDHPLAAVLVLSAAAVVAGMRSFTAIAGWIADAPAEVLTCAYAGSERPASARGPSKVTVWRVLIGIDAAKATGSLPAWTPRSPRLKIGRIGADCLHGRLSRSGSPEVLETARESLVIGSL